MIIASEKRKNNVGEYLLYMWQVEDIIRANDLDIEKIRHNVIDRFDLTDQQRQQMVEWYESLIDMMRREGVTEHGHLQMNKNILNQLVQLHQALLADPEFADYTAEFYRTLPFIVELRGKAGDKAVGEIETCFTALYGMLLMRLQKKEINENTSKAIAQIAKFISVLVKDFHLDEKEELFKPKDTDETPSAEK